MKPKSFRPRVPTALANSVRRHDIRPTRFLLVVRIATQTMWLFEKAKLASVIENSFSGSTGDPPVPSGDSPDGTAAMVPANKDGLFAKALSAVPVGGSPTGAGESPARPNFRTRSEMLEPGLQSNTLRSIRRFMGGGKTGWESQARRWFASTSAERRFPPYEFRRRFVISTSAFGIGQQHASDQTPLGLHRIAKKIGAGWPMGTVFRYRQVIGFTWQGMPEARIVHRILWLEGLEPGFNRGGEVDTFRRFIYLHGFGDETTLGRPCSHGCIHVSATDLLPLFDRLPVGTLVWIAER